MARITVEDCLENVENRFVLVLDSAKRARQLSLTMAEPKVPRDNDKPTVIALREIAANLLTGEEEVSEEGEEGEDFNPENTEAEQLI